MLSPGIDSPRKTHLNFTSTFFTSRSPCSLILIQIPKTPNTNPENSQHKSRKLPTQIPKFPETFRKLPKRHPERPGESRRILPIPAELTDIPAELTESFLGESPEQARLWKRRSGASDGSGGRCSTWPLAAPRLPDRTGPRS
eukprot:171103-Prorocentrum_minimum.AAC.6